MMIDPTLTDHQLGTLRWVGPGTKGRMSSPQYQTAAEARISGEQSGWVVASLREVIAIWRNERFNNLANTLASCLPAAGAAD